MKINRRQISLMAAAICTPWVSIARAQAYPARPIRLIVPYPPGGGTDVVARIVARKMGESLGQQVVVENRPGASSIIGTDAVAKAPADGYTIGLVTDSHSINFAFRRKLPYQSSDFTPIIQLLNVPLMLLSNADSPVRSLDTLVSYAKANPGKLTFASAGLGSPHELAALWLYKLEGVDVQIIQYKGVAPALADVVSGQVDMLFTGGSVAAGHLKAGKLRAVGTTAQHRLAASPDVPAIAERFPDYVVTTWYGIIAPAGVPPMAASRLHEEFARALQSNEVRQQIATLGGEVVGGASTELARLMTRDTERWTRVIQLTGAKPE